MFDLSAAVIEAMQDAARDAALAAAQTFGFGGATWTVERKTGNGVSAPATSAPASSITGYAYRQRPGARAPTAAQTAALDDQWFIIVTAGEVKVRDVLTSVADGRALTVKTREPWYEYQRCEVEPVR